jgi:hypothetical protein
MTNTQTLIAEVYSAFNQRNIDDALALMTENVSWPKASESGRVVGKEEIRAYWSRQWKEFDPHVAPIEVIDRGAGKIDVSRGNGVRYPFSSLQGSELHAASPLRPPRHWVTAPASLGNNEGLKV